MEVGLVYMALGRLPLLVNLSWRFFPGEGCEQRCSKLVTIADLKITTAQQACDMHSAEAQ